jgi:hypothetical protein
LHEPIALSAACTVCGELPREERPASSEELLPSGVLLRNAAAGIRAVWAWVGVISCQWRWPQMVRPMVQCAAPSRAAGDDHHYHTTALLLTSRSKLASMPLPLL